MPSCVRCGRTEQLEEHHIKEQSRGGSNEPHNKEWRCRACHKYEHAHRNVEWFLEHIKRQGQRDRVKVCEHRLEVLEALNTPELIRERGTYLSYWADASTHYLPEKKTPKQLLRMNITGVEIEEKCRQMVMEV